jgi:phage terminase Nu1 subunit (DNA packaging protein)
MVNGKKPTRYILIDSQSVNLRSFCKSLKLYHSGWHQAGIPLVNARTGKNLASYQKKVLKALARKPTASIYANDYLRENYPGVASSAKRL